MNRQKDLKEKAENRESVGETGKWGMADSIIIIAASWTVPRRSTIIRNPSI